MAKEALPKYGWRVNDWADSVGISRAYLYELLGDGRVESCKVGGARIITTPPDEFLRRAAAENDL